MRSWIILPGIQYLIYFAVSYVRARRRGQEPGSAAKRILARSLAPVLRYIAATGASLAVAVLIWANAWALLFESSLVDALREDGSGSALVAALLLGGFAVFLLGWRLRFVRVLAPVRVLAAGTPSIDRAGGWSLPSLRIVGWALSLGALGAVQMARSWEGLLEYRGFWAPAAVCAAVGFLLLIVTTKRDVAALAALTRRLAWVPPAPPVASKEVPKSAGRRTRTTPRAAPRRAPTHRVTGRDSHAPRRERPLRAAGR